MPPWVLYVEYAEQFGNIQPHEVPKKVPVSWWLRWKFWRKAQASRSMWEAWRANPKAASRFDKDDMDTWYWALLKDKR